jgi:cysteine desulfurase
MMGSEPGSSAATSAEVYLDYNATTRLAPEVVAAMVAHMETYGNPSSLHGFGHAASAAVETARAQVARLLNVEPRQVIFTGSGTEADNFAVKGTALRHPPEDCHVVTTCIEHAAVLASCRRLEALGYPVTYLPVSPGGVVDPDDVRRHLRRNTRLISVMHANNEIGVVQPIEEIGSIAQEAGILFHTDAVQTVGKTKLDMAHLPIDMLALTGHKFHGPKGVGALVMRDGVPLQRLVDGGGHEDGRRAGTENVLGIVGLGAACEMALRVHSSEYERQRGLRDRLWQGLAELGDAHVNGDMRCVMPGTLNVGFRFIKGHALADALAIGGVAVSTGSACHAHEVKPSHVLQALGTPDDLLHGAIRISLGRYTTAAEVERALDVATRAVTRLRAASPIGRARRFVLASGEVVGRAVAAPALDPTAEPVG